jgi:ankyrin repeat protein
LILNADAAQSCSEDRENFRLVLLWLVAAARPLTAVEIQHALDIRNFEPGQFLGPSLTNRDSSIDHLQSLIRLCGPLVKLGNESKWEQKTIMLTHFSLKEYLLSSVLKNNTDHYVRTYYMEPYTIHNHIAKACFTYLTSQEFSRPYQSRQDLEDKRRKHKLLDYSVLYTGKHVSQLSKIEKELNILFDAFFVPEITWKDSIEPGSSGVAGRSPLQTTFSFTLPFDRDEVYFNDTVSLTEAIQPEVFPINDEHDPYIDHLAQFQKTAVLAHKNCISWQQVNRVLSTTSQRDHPLNATLLYFASMIGWHKGVEIILKRQTSRATVSDLNHSLRAAGSGGFCEIIELLYREGADVNISLGALGSAIQAAAYCGQTKAVKTLRALGSDIAREVPYYRPGGTVGSSLQGAAVTGNLELVEYLVAEGADINANNGWLGTALQAAIEAGKHDVALFLIGREEFDARVIGGYYGSALRLLCHHHGEFGREPLIRIISKGGDPSQRLHAYGSLLEIACHFGHFDRAQELVDLGAKLDGCSGQFGNAIQAAAISGNPEILDLLLDGHGVDNISGFPSNPNAQGSWFWTEFAPQVAGYKMLGRCAILPGYETLGRCAFLQGGEGFLASRNSLVTRGFFSPALHAGLRLCETEHNETFMLFEHEPTHARGHLGNPLQAAAFHGHLDAVDVLIKKGAIINCKNGFFGTALQAAASQKHVAAVELLLRAGADANAVSEGYYGTALNAACSLGFYGVAQKLVEYGACYLTVDNHGWDASTWGFMGLHPSNFEHSASAGNLRIRRPSRWSLTEKSPLLLLDVTGCMAQLPQYPFSDMRPLQLPAKILADHPVSPHHDTYFEVFIKETVDG